MSASQAESCEFDPRHPLQSLTTIRSNFQGEIFLIRVGNFAGADDVLVCRRENGTEGLIGGKVFDNQKDELSI